MNVKTLFLFAAISACGCTGTELLWDQSNGFSQWGEARRATLTRENTLLQLSNIGKDHSITHSRLNLQPGEFDGIEIVYRAGNMATKTTGQIYFDNESSNGFTDHQRWNLPSLQSDGKWHTLKINEKMLNNPTLFRDGGVIKALRLDLTDQPGGTIEIRSIRLFKHKPDNSIAIKKWPVITVADRPKFSGPPIHPECYFRGKMMAHPHDDGKSKSTGNFYLRREFAAPADLQNAYVQMTADDEADLYLNGQLVLSQNGRNCWRKPVSAPVAKYLHPGKNNTIGIAYRNRAAAGGILFELTMNHARGTERVHSDHRFKSSETYAKNWSRSGFYDQLWSRVLLHDPPPAAPWKSHVLDYTDFSKVAEVVSSAVKNNFPVQAGEHLDLMLQIRGSKPSGSIVLDAELLNEQDTVLFRQKVTATPEQGKGTDNTWTLNLSYFPPKYWRSGNWRLRLIGRSMHLEHLPVVNFSFQELKKSSTPTVARIDRTQSGPTIQVNKRNHYMLMGNRNARIFESDWSGFSKMPVNFASVSLPSHLLEFHRADGSFDMTVLDAQINRVLSFDERVNLIVFIPLYPPNGWGKRHPEAMARFDNGQPVDDRAYSLNSPVARQMLSRALTALIEYAETAPYRDKIAGYALCSGETTEWLTWSFNSNLRYKRLTDYSQNARESFRTFAKKTYPELGNNTELPAFPARTALASRQSILDPSGRLLDIAINDYNSFIMADTLLYMGRLARSKTNQRKLIGCYYGYTFELAGMAGAVPQGAHFDLYSVLNAKVFDFFMSPQSYQNRGIGGFNLDMKPFETIRAHGAVALIDDDTRTHRTPASGYDQTLNAQQTVAVFRRNSGSYLCRLQPFNLLPLAYGNEFTDPQLIHDAGIVQRTGQYLWDSRIPRRAEIALVVSERSMKYLPFEKHFDQIGKEQFYRDDGTPSERTRATLHLTGELIARAREVTAQIGAPVDYILAEDLIRHPGNYKFYIFLNLFESNPELLNTVRELEKRSCTLLYLYAPGLISARRQSLESMEKLTGFRFGRSDAPSELRLTTPSGKHMGIVGSKIAPSFYVTPTPDLLWSAPYHGSDKLGMAARRNTQALCIFSGVPTLTPEFLQELAREQRIHLFSETNDFLEANGALVMLYAHTSGEKCIKLPRKTDIVNVFTRKILARNTDMISIRVPLHSTTLLFYGDAQKYLSATQ